MIRARLRMRRKKVITMTTEIGGTGKETAGQQKGAMEEAMRMKLPKDEEQDMDLNVTNAGVAGISPEIARPRRSKVRGEEKEASRVTGESQEERRETKEATRVTREAGTRTARATRAAQEVTEEVREEESPRGKQEERQATDEGLYRAATGLGCKCGEKGHIGANWPEGSSEVQGGQGGGRAAPSPRTAVTRLLGRRAVGRG